MKNKILITVISILIVLALAAASVFVITSRNKNPDTQPESDVKTVSEQAEALQPYMPDYTVDEIEEILNTPLDDNTMDAIDKAFGTTEVAEVVEADPDSDVIVYKNANGDIVTEEKPDLSFLDKIDPDTFTGSALDYMDTQDDTTGENNTGTPNNPDSSDDASDEQPPKVFDPNDTYYDMDGNIAELEPPLGEVGSIGSIDDIDSLIPDGN